MNTALVLATYLVVTGPAGVVFRVIDAESGKPITNAQVEIRQCVPDENGQFPLVERGYTGADGKWEPKAILTGPVRIRVVIKAYKQSGVFPTELKEPAPALLDPPDPQIIQIKFNKEVAQVDGLKSPGLRGILSKNLPNGLGPDEFSKVAGNWRAWAQELSELVTQLYTDQQLDLASQKSLLRELQRKIRTIDMALADPRFADLYDPLAKVRAQLARRVDIAEAILDTLEMTPEDVRRARVASATGEVLEALASLEQELAKLPRGSAWLLYIRADDLRQSLTTGEQDGVVEFVEERLNTGKSLTDAKQREFLRKPEFKRLALAVGALRKARRTHVAPTDEELLRQTLAEFAHAIEAYEDQGTAAASRKARESLAAAGHLALDRGDRLEEAFRKHYLNYNLQVIASETALNKLVGRRTTTRSISETTTTQTRVNLLEGSDAARMELVIDGVSQRSTVDAPGQVPSDTLEDHRFAAVKSVQFNGVSLTTSPARMTRVTPNSLTFGAPPTDAGQRVENRVLPELDARAEDVIRDTNRRLQDNLRKRLEQGGVSPLNVHTRSNTHYLRLGAQILEGGELGGDAGGPPVAPPSSLVLRLHESLLNNAINRMKLAGRTMTDEQIFDEVERYLSLLAGRSIKIRKLSQPGAVAERNWRLVFDKEDPIRFNIENGEINLVLKAGFKQHGKEDIPTQLITVPLRLTAKGDHIQVDPGTVEIAAAHQTFDRAAQIVRAGVVKKKLEQVIQPTLLDGVLHVARPGRSEVDFTIAHIEAENGWLTFAAH